MQTLVKQLVNEDQNPIPVDGQRWHAIHHVSGDLAMICTGEFICYGAGAGEYITKDVKRGGITCDRCIEVIKYYKAIKL